MKIPLNRRSPDPVYLQIRDHIGRLIRAGALQPGDRLPSIRTMAEDVQVNKLTVIEAYGVLEADGLIHARPGAGYFVNSEVCPSPQRNSTFAPAQEVLIPSDQDMSFYNLYTTSMQVQQQPDTIDFTCGVPRSEGLEDLQRIARRASGQLASNLFGYEFPQGQPTLRKQITQMLVQQGLEVSPDQLIITTGSMQGLSLTIQHHVQPGDWVIVESPTFHGALAILKDLGAKVIGIPMTAEGMNLDLLEQYLQSHRPKLIYTMSTLHNPTGLTTSLAHRQQLLALAEQYNCPILEDNAYEGLNFEPVPAPIKALDRRDSVIFLGTFSKTLIPGLRVGYMVVTGATYQRMVERKLLSDLTCSSISQAIVSEYLASGHFRRHLNRTRSQNLQTRNVMLRSLEQHFPTEASWTVPKGGIFLWVHLPAHLSMREISHKALAEQVLVSAGSPFFPDQQGYPAMRLSFSHTPEDIERGVAILGRLIKAQLTPTQVVTKPLQPIQVYKKFA
jgi:DNA-binding transcriptional MocR family regulator